MGTAPLKCSTDALSKLAQIAQLPEALEFGVADKPAILHHTGPFVDTRFRLCSRFSLGRDSMEDR